MTIIAGAISRNGGKLPEGLREALSANLSRFPGDIVERIGGDRWFLAKVDVEALKCKGSISEPGGAALVIAGESLLAEGPAGTFDGREGECRALFDDLRRNGRTALQSATGTYCGAFYSPADHRLTLIADKLGIRPLYYLVTPEFAAFASALRVFEAAGLHAGAVDLRGTYATCAFGYPLGTRTCYAAVRTIDPAELVHVTADATTCERHFSGTGSSARKAVTRNCARSWSTLSIGASAGACARTG